MARDLGVLPSEMGVVLSSYLMALAIFIPASGALADRFGAKSIFQSAIAVFVLTSVICGLTDNLAALVLARFGQGIGGAMMTSVGR
jgi:MFS family permease